ncbi:MAG: glycogen/starch synthase [Bacteroidales bacterium]|nr:glycogen/starch synthase [Bacteroidales bacterium]
MGDVKRVLFVSSEIFPYLPESPVGNIGRYLPQGIQERKREIRSFMPRYGCINERKNQLHEVIRLSGMNIVIGDIDRPLIIKVASISAARMQVYFIDNDDYFHRKQTYCDAEGKFFEDNGERAVFFARGVLETVKKLRWAPDVIHCHGWISHLLPLYLKKAYRDDPIFADSKVVLSLYDDTPAESFGSDFAEKVLFGGISASDVQLTGKADGTELAELAIRYSDGVIMGSANVDAKVGGFCRESGLPVLDYDAAKIADGSYIDDYNSFYEQL